MTVPANTTTTSSENGPVANSYVPSPNTSGANTPTTPIKLTYRLAKEHDLPTLREYRMECGWGLERLAEYWDDPDRPLCVFTMEKDGKKEDVGMGGWILRLEDDLEAASKEHGSVGLTSLFIQKKYQSYGLGRLAMDLLEQGAAEHFHAKSVTLDTAAYEIDFSNEGKTVTENPNVPSRNSLWYQRRGFQVYRYKPKYADFNPDEPDKLLTAAFMRKMVS